jgi:hypothetical protein
MTQTITDPDEWREWWANRNPFLESYTMEEIEAYAVSEYDKDGVKISSERMFGVVPDYLNKAFQTGTITVPMLTIDNKLWMSITCMETQSQHLPIQFAQDNVATAGLGMGHFTLRCMESPMVSTITVFERDERVIKYFKSCFSKRPGFDKVKFVLGDARETLKGYEFDFLYVDIYPDRLSDDVISDAELFLSENDIEPVNYHFWGREHVILDAYNHGLITLLDIDIPTADYLRTWFNQPIERQRDGGTTKLSQMYEIKAEPRYCEDVLEAIDFHHALD